MVCTDFFLGLWGLGFWEAKEFRCLGVTMSPTKGGLEGFAQGSGWIVLRPLKDNRRRIRNVVIELI